MDKQDLLKEYQELQKIVIEVDQLNYKLSSMLEAQEKFVEWYVETFSEKIVRKVYEFDNEIFEIKRNGIYSVAYQIRDHKNPNALFTRIRKKLKQLEEITQNEEE